MEGKDSPQEAIEAGADSVQAPFDLESSLARLGGSHELFRSIVEFFLDDCPTLLQQLNVGLASGDGEQVERAAHSIKGLAANFSAQSTVQAALEIEDLGRSRDLAAARQSLPKLQSELDRLQRALRATVHECPS